jgi:preprotein translocase subunit SecE
MAGKISTYIDDVRTEIKKVNWLSKDELMGSTVVVAVFSILMAIFLFVADFGVSELISWFLRR